MSNRFDGDLKLFLDEDGAYCRWVNGQPIMDRGLENSVLIALLTKNDDYWGNYLETDEHEKLGSLFTDIIGQPITLDTFNTARTNAEKDLQFLTKMKIANAVNMKIQSPTYNSIEAVIRIISPQSETELVLSNMGDVWKYQLIDPAYVKDVK